MTGPEVPLSSDKRGGINWRADFKRAIWSSIVRRVLFQRNLHATVYICVVYTFLLHCPLLAQWSILPSRMKETHALRRALDVLPLSLPEPPLSDYPFLGFRLPVDEEAYEVFNRQLELTFGRAARAKDGASGARIITFTERGPGILAVTDLLDQIMARFPGDAVFRKWIMDLTVSAELQAKPAVAVIAQVCPSLCISDCAIYAHNLCRSRVKDNLHHLGAG